MSIFTNWGSTLDDRKEQFSCDNKVRDVNGRYYRVVDIDAPAENVYRWICQMKVAPYSYDLLDNGGKQSPQHLTPGVGLLKKNQKMMTIFHIDSFVPQKEVTLVMDMPPEEYAKWYVPTAITYKLIDKGDNKCRLVVKYAASWTHTLFGWFERVFIIFADFIMMRRQLLNFKKLAEKEFIKKRFTYYSLPRIM